MKKPRSLDDTSSTLEPGEIAVHAAFPTYLDTPTRVRVLLLVRAIPEGRWTSYGAIGAAAGISGRAVGQLLRHATDGTPWWRVLCKNGAPSPRNPFRELQLELLADEQCEPLSSDPWDPPCDD